MYINMGIGGVPLPPPKGVSFLAPTRTCITCTLRVAGKWLGYKILRSPDYYTNSVSGNLSVFE